MRFRLFSIAALAIAVAALGATDDVTTNISAAAGSVRAQGGAGRPDVIIVLTDQQRADAFGAAGAPPIFDSCHGPPRTRGGPVHPRVRGDTTVLAVPGRVAHGPLSSPDRRDGKHRRPKRGGSERTCDRPAGMSVALDRSLPTIGRVFARRRIRDSLFRQMAPRRHARRVRVRVARLHDQGRGHLPATSLRSCRSAPEAAHAGHSC